MLPRPLTGRHHAKGDSAMRNTSNLVAGLVAVAFGLALIFWITPAQTVPAVFASVPSAFYADFTSSMLIVSGLALAVSGVFGKANEARETTAGRIGVCFTTAFVLLVAAMLITPLFGFWQTGILICLVTLLLMHEYRWHLLAAISITAPVVVWGVFELLLGRPMP